MWYNVKHGGRVDEGEHGRSSMGREGAWISSQAHDWVNTRL